MAEEVYGQDNQPVLTGLYDVPAVDDSIDFKLAHVKQVGISKLSCSTASQHDSCTAEAVLLSVVALCSWPAGTPSTWREKISMSSHHSLHQLRCVCVPCTSCNHPTYLM
jgi:hypothetical protein